MTSLMPFRSTRSKHESSEYFLPGKHYDLCCLYMLISHNFLIIFEINAKCKKYVNIKQATTFFIL